ncbi:MAG: hypothetical protein ACI9P5_002996 [Saprospiraceae bacterium]|jgi:hypothetical protein
MKNVIFALLFIGILVQYSNSDDPVAKDKDTPLVSAIELADISNNGNGSDLQIKFNKASDERLIS